LSKKFNYSSRKLVISDLYLCLFDTNKTNKGEMILDFWSSFNGILNVEKSLDKDELILIWRQGNKVNNKII
jgi:hypothetical protein